MADMAEKIIWLAACLLAYVVFCLVAGYLGARASKRTGSFFVTDRTSAPLRGACAFTACTLGAWVLLAHPGLIYRDGLPAASLFAAAVLLPACGFFVFGRLASLGQRSEKASLANLLEEYFQSTQVRNLVILAGLGFALPLLAWQFSSAGTLINLLSDDTVSRSAAMLVIAGLVTLYVAWGGVRATLACATVQFVLMLAGIIAIGCVALYYIGGFAKLSEGVAALGEIDTNRTATNLSHYLALPGLIQFETSAREAVGSPWTGTMLATTMLAFTGIMVSPVIATWALCVKGMTSVQPRMIWTSAVLLGFVLLVFSVVQGLGGHLLGGNLAMSDERGEFVYNIMGANLGGMDLMETEGQEAELVPVLIHLLGDTLPWLFALLTVAAIAALNATSAALLSGTTTLLARAGFARTDNLTASRLQAAAVTLALTAAALALAWVQESAQINLTHLALAIGVQMWPAVIGVCWVPRLTGRAVAAGLVFGIIAAFATEPFGVEALNITAWGGWPFTVHSAFWGLLVNVTTVTVVSMIGSSPERLIHRKSYQDDAEALKGPALTRAAAVTVVWLIFAAGPGTMIGNSLFGSPDDRQTWFFGVPSLWVWQAVWWSLGITLLIYLAKLTKRPAAASS
ncbi:MAG: hypothetical protein AAGF86_04840 [Pseudomonadota bacterium]